MEEDEEEGEFKVSRGVSAAVIDCTQPVTVPEDLKSLYLIPTYASLLPVEHIYRYITKMPQGTTEKAVYEYVRNAFQYGSDRLAVLARIIGKSKSRK